MRGRLRTLGYIELFADQRGVLLLGMLGVLTVINVLLILRIVTLTDIGIRVLIDIRIL
jgi:competence protein ComGC